MKRALQGRAFALVLVCFTVTAKAQSSAPEARALVADYIGLHNAHDLQGVMALYAEEAVFHLSMQRGEVVGREAIRELERFDVAAGSTLYPMEMTVRQVGDRWHVDIGHVLEHSEIFAAAGAKIVRTEAVTSGFILSGGRIVEIRQPELRKACTDIVLAAFRGAAQWLNERQDERTDRLLSDGRLDLTPETIPEIVTLLQEWRRETGQQTPPGKAGECAGFIAGEQPSRPSLS